jgi:putative tricarboxylic transport membrane protein
MGTETVIPTRIAARVAELTGAVDRTIAMTIRKINIIVAVIAILIGAGTLFLLPSQVSEETISALTDTNSPAFFPIISAFLVILCGLVLFFKTITLDRFDDKRATLIPYPGFLVVMIIIFSSYALLIQRIGMITASVLMIPAMSYALGYRKVITTIAVAVSVPLILFILFEKFLLIILPHGILF